MTTATKAICATGRRKTAVARVRLLEGSGKITINGKTVDQYFTETVNRSNVWAPIERVDLRNKLDFIVKVNGGGFNGQAGAVMLGIARAIKIYKPESDHDLRDGGLLTRDSRMKERKKYGQKGARKRFQFSKR